MLLMFLTRMRKHKSLTYIAVLVMPAAMNAAEVSYAPADTVPEALQEVTVTGSRSVSSLSSSAPVHRIDAEMMKTQGVTDIADALHRLPGVTLRDYGGAGGLKTVSVRGFGASHTSVSYDGVPLSDAQSGQIDLSRYSLDNVDAISMTVGDNADIFTTARSAASAANLEISTDSPFLRNSAKTSATVQLKAGSFGYWSPYFRVQVPVGNVLLHANGEFVHSRNDYPFTLVNGDFKTKEKRNNSMMNSGHADINMRWNISQGHTLAAKGYYYDNGRQLPGPVVYYNTVCNERLRERNAFGQMRYRGRLGSKVSLMAIAKFNWSSSFYSDRDGKYPGGILEQNYWQREAYVAASALYTPAQWLSLDYAADYFYNNLNSNLNTDTRPRRHSILQSITAKVRFGGLTAMARLLGSIYLNEALDGESARDARKLSPSLSLSWQPVDSRQLYLRASYKNIFRMPTFNEAYFDHYGSTNVLPESTDQINIGITYGVPPFPWLAEASVTFDAYMNHVKDKIVAVPYNMFIWTMVNLSKVRVFGMDATLNTRFLPGGPHALTVAGNYSLQRAQPRTSPESRDWMKQVAYVPLHSGAVSVGWENPWLNLSAHMTAVSERYTTNYNLPQTRIAGYVEFGAGLWREFAIRRTKLELRFDLMNLFNTQYEIVATYPMPGRAWQASVRFTF